MHFEPKSFSFLNSVSVNERQRCPQKATEQKIEEWHDLLKRKNRSDQELGRKWRRICPG